MKDYLYKLVSFNQNGKKELGIVLDKIRNEDGTCYFLIFGQRTNKSLWIGDKFTNIILEE